MQRTYRFLLVLVLLAGLASAQRPQRSILDVATAPDQTENFSTVVTALRLVGLDTLLTEPGPFTVFLPTNAAFAQLSPAELNALLADPLALSAVLSYHVIPGALVAANVVRTEAATTLFGEELRLPVQGGVPTANGARIIATDIMARNGVIHMVDRVLVPSSLLEAQPQVHNSVLEIITSEPQYSILAGLIQQAGLAQALTTAAPFTLFAPTNDAFARVPQVTLDALAADPALLREVLLYHILIGRAISADLINLDDVNTAQGNLITINVAPGVFGVNQARVTRSDIIASNGVIHAIDTVLVSD